MIHRPEFSSRIWRRSMAIDWHKTSISLEPAFWSALKEIAASEELSIPQLVSRIDTEREDGNLSSAIRLFVLDHYRHLAEEKAKR